MIFFFRVFLQSRAGHHHFSHQSLSRHRHAARRQVGARRFNISLQRVRVARAVAKRGDAGGEQCQGVEAEGGDGEEGELEGLRVGIVACCFFFFLKRFGWTRPYLLLPAHRGSGTIRHVPVGLASCSG